MTSRLFILCGCLLAPAIYLGAAMEPEVVPLRRPLSALPGQVDRWTGHDEPRFTAEVEAVLGVDDYVNRVYSADGEPAIGLYVGYYASQRQGDTIHSPMNCLPGAGWQPVAATRVRIDIPGHGAPIDANRVSIEKGINRQVVLYWYESHGRAVASEYWSKLYMVYDALRTNRSDAALVRVVTPVAGGGSDASAADRAVAFARAVYADLRTFLPS